VTPDIYVRLRPWLCALPRAEASSINVDTLLPEQAPLIAMLAPGTIGIEQVRAALLARPAAGYASVGDFWRSPSLVGANAGDVQSQTGVRTRWFALRVDVAIGDARIEEHALIDATQLPPRLVSRQWGERS
jgi:general secretion pathway protein K